VSDFLNLPNPTVTYTESWGSEATNQPLRDQKQKHSSWCVETKLQQIGGLNWPTAQMTTPRQW